MSCLKSGGGLTTVLSRLEMSREIEAQIPSTLTQYMNSVSNRLAHRAWLQDWFPWRHTPERHAV